MARFRITHSCLSCRLLIQVPRASHELLVLCCTWLRNLASADVPVRGHSGYFITLLIEMLNLWNDLLTWLRIRLVDRVDEFFINTSV